MLRGVKGLGFVNGRTRVIELCAIVNKIQSKQRIRRRGEGKARGRLKGMKKKPMKLESKAIGINTKEEGMGSPWRQKYV